MRFALHSIDVFFFSFLHYTSSKPFLNWSYIRVMAYLKGYNPGVNATLLLNIISRNFSVYVGSFGLNSVAESRYCGQTDVFVMQCQFLLPVIITNI